MAEKTQKTQNNNAREDLFQLARRSRADDASAREQLILSHMSLAETLARQYAGRGVEDEDLFQEACFGLLLAVDRYDPDQGYLFSTYATYWINKRLKRAIRLMNQGYPVVLEESAFYDIQKYQQTLATLTKDLGRTPTDEEVARHMGKKTAAIRRLRSRSYTFTSLDSGDQPTPSGVGNQHIVPTHKQSPSAEEDALRSLGEHEEPAIFSCLTLRQREIVLRHHGLSASGLPESFREISAAMGWSMETIRLDYHDAASKLFKQVYPCLQQPSAHRAQKKKTPDTK